MATAITQLSSGGAIAAGLGTIVRFSYSSGAVSYSYIKLLVASGEAVPQEFVIPVGNGGVDVYTGTVQYEYRPVIRYRHNPNGGLVGVSGDAVISGIHETSYAIPVGDGGVALSGSYASNAVLPMFGLTGAAINLGQGAMRMPMLRFFGWMGGSRTDTVANTIEMVLTPGPLTEADHIYGRISVPSIGVLNVAGVPLTKTIGTQGGIGTGAVVIAGVNPSAQIKGKVSFLTYTTPTITISSPGGFSSIVTVRRTTEVVYGLGASVLSYWEMAYSVVPELLLEVMYNIRPKVSAYWEPQYRLRNTDDVGTSVEPAYDLEFTAYVDAVYDLVQNMPVSAYLETYYTLLENVQVSAYCEAVYDLVALSAVSASLETVYDILALGPVQFVIDFNYALVENESVDAHAEVVYSIRPFVSSYWDIAYRYISQVGQHREVQYDLMSKSPVGRAWNCLYNVKALSTVFVIGQPYITHNGQQIDIISASVNASEGNYLWVGEFELANIADYQRMRRGDAITFTMYSDTFSLIVTEKTGSRPGVAQQSLRLTASSPVALKANPVAKPITYMNDTPKRVSVIASELMGGGVTWNTVDWTLPAYRFAVEESDPVSAVEQLATACGALPVSLKDGTFIVRPLFPVSPQNDYGMAAVHTFTEFDDQISSEESYRAGVVYNRFRISDSEIAMSDSLEWEPDYEEATTGYIVGRLSPWRTEVNLLHTSRSPVFIGAPEIHFEEHEDRPEFFKGVGNTTEPVYDILSVEWISLDAGAISFDEGSTALRVSGSGNGIAKIKYRSRVMKWRADTVARESTQFLLSSLTIQG